MLIIPAIDLLGGECVRLYRGDYGKKTVYEKDPAAIARRFQEAGARLIHIVDLDRARGDKKGNRAAIRAIRQALDEKKENGTAVEVGGGVRALDDVRELLDCGVERVIIGTALVKEPEAVASWIASEKFYPIAGLDVQDRLVKIQGWTDSSAVRDTKIAARLSGMGFREIIYTNIMKDGTLAGPDVESTNEIAQASKLPVVLSGGIGGAADVARVHDERHPLVYGVIIGKALYEGKADLADLISLYQKTDDIVNLRFKGKN